MKAIYLSATMLVFCFAAAYGQGKDSLTGLPVVPAAETVVAGKSYGFQPGPMPGSIVCKSKMKGAFYVIGNMNVKDNKAKVGTVAAWYTAHLPGFKMVQGYARHGAPNGRSQTVFYNSDGTTLVVITGSTAPQGQDAVTYGIAYQRYEPGISEKAIVSLTQEKIVCQ